MSWAVLLFSYRRLCQMDWEVTHAGAGDIVFLCRWRGGIPSRLPAGPRNGQWILSGKTITQEIRELMSTNDGGPRKQAHRQTWSLDAQCVGAGFSGGARHGVQRVLVRGRDSSTVSCSRLGESNETTNVCCSHTAPCLCPSP